MAFNVRNSGEYHKFEAFQLNLNNFFFKVSIQFFQRFVLNDRFEICSALFFNEKFTVKMDDNR